MLKLHQVLKSSRAAIDLASIMVGIIVIGLIGGVIAATVFAVIPWSQDNAAKQQLDPIASAESAYRGLSTSKDTNLQDAASSPTSATDPNQVVLNSAFTGSSGLAKNNLLSLSPNGAYCVIATVDGKDYHAYSKSGSGKWFYSTSGKTQASEYTGGDIPCVTTDTATSTNPVGTVDPAVDNGSTAVGTKPVGGGSPGGTTPPVNVPNTTTTIITVNCAIANTYTVPFYQFNGTMTVNDISDGKQYVNTRPTISAAAGTTYTLKLTGTYTSLQVNNVGSTVSDPCLRTVDAWGDTSKTTSVAQAFSGATNLVSVPDYLPTNFTDLIAMFNNATSFNSPNITNWNMTKVRYVNNMFNGATSFNQDLSKWDVTNILTYRGTFFGAKAFNQNLSGWKTANATDMQVMFANTTSFSQDISGWDVTKVTTYGSFASGSKLTSVQIPAKFR
jgi:surface protein